MSIIGVLIILVVIGFLLWLATTYIPMNDTIKKIMIGFVIICVILWLLNITGVLSMNMGTVPRVR